jgi:thiosulfate/3-mercaptopyruvate sulfurtransferase
MAFRTLINAAALTEQLSSPNIRIVDCRFKLDDTGWGEREYLTRHIPGAVYAHLDRDLSGETTGANGRHPLPDPARLERTFGRLGIGTDTQVVAYDQNAGMYASRLWWMLRWLGHHDVAVLDGGFACWTTEGRPTASGPEPTDSREFIGAPRTTAVVDTEELGRLMRDPEAKLVDARAPERYCGAAETVDRVGGHIPGAVNHFFMKNVDETGLLRPVDELRAAFHETLGGTPPGRAIVYCGSGVTACQNLLALEHAGLPGARLYAGSWSEWSADPARPIARSGAAPGRDAR